MRPVLGSIATTEPLNLPRPSTAACRTIGSSKVGSSRLNESAYVGTPPRNREINRRTRDGECVFDFEVDFVVDFNVDLTTGLGEASAAGSGTLSTAINEPRVRILPRLLNIKPLTPEANSAP